MILVFSPSLLLPRIPHLPHHRHLRLSAINTPPSTNPSKLTTDTQPKSFTSFMKTQGFAEPHIQKLITLNPRCLTLNITTSLLPKLQTLHGLGFSHSDLTHLLLSNPNLLNPTFHLTKIHLWIRLLGSVELLIKYVRSNQWILSYSLHKTVLPNLQLLRGCGISEERISMVVRKHPRIVLHKPEALEQLIKQVEEMGVPRGSGMFIWALWTVRRVSKARIIAKMEILMGFGWSAEEFTAAFRKAPGFLSVSEGKMKEKMEFLVNVAGCEPGYVAVHPLLLSYSLERRLIPRFRVVEMLKLRGLDKGRRRLFSLMTISEKKFMEKFVLCYQEVVPGLLDDYVACCDRGVV